MTGKLYLNDIILIFLFNSSDSTPSKYTNIYSLLFNHLGFWAIFLHSSPFNKSVGSTTTEAFLPINSSTISAPLCSLTDMFGISSSHFLYVEILLFGILSTPKLAAYEIRFDFVAKSINSI